MKKCIRIFALFILLVSVCTMVGGCGKIDGKESTVQSSLDKDENEKKLAGKWDFVSWKETTSYNETEETVYYETHKKWFTFILITDDGLFVCYNKRNDDNSYRSDDGFGTYTLEDDKIIISTGRICGQGDYSLDGDTLSFTVTDDYGYWKTTTECVMTRADSPDTCDNELHGIWYGKDKNGEVFSLIFTEYGYYLAARIGSDDASVCVCEMVDGKAVLVGDNTFIPSMKGTYTIGGDLLIIKGREFDFRNNVYGKEIPELVLTKQDGFNATK